VLKRLTQELPAEQWISYRITSLVWCCLLGLALVYLRELCCPLLSVLWALDCSAHSNRVYSLSLLSVPPLGRAMPSGGPLDLERSPFWTSSS